MTSAATNDAGGADTAPPVLVVRDLSVSYGRVRALREVSLTVRPGGLVLVLGLNGAGKSTLMRAIAGAVPCAGGSVVLAGRDVTRTAAHRRVRAGVSLVPEGRGVLPGLSVRDNLDLGWNSAPRSRRVPKAGAVAQVTDLFPILSDRLDQDCSTLSGGEMQMLAIGRALLARPTVMLLDEPSLGLAPKVVSAVYAAVGRLGEQGVTTIVVEQKAVPLTRTPDTVLVLRGGRVVHTMRDARPTAEELARLYLDADIDTDIIAGSTA